MMVEEQTKIKRKHLNCILNQLIADVLQVNVCGLGNCYYYGNGIIIDYNKAFEWYSKSANSESTAGQYHLGNCYYHGIGTNRDYNKAFEWYSKSADSGCAEGQRGLGNCYKYGRGTM